MPPSMGPGARPLQPGESPGGLLKEITEIRKHYNVHLASNAIDLAYELKGQQRQFSLPFDNMPVGSWTKALCFGGPSSAAVTGTLLIDLIRAAENMSGRQLTQEEAEGVAYYGSRRMLTMYVGQLTGIALGVGSAWTGRKNMKFPFIKPKSPERYDSFPLRMLPLLKGQYARAMWHITRANIYVVMWLFLTNPFFRSIADTRMTVGLYQDRRTHNMAQVVKNSFDRIKGNRAAEGMRGVEVENRMQSSQDSQTPQNADDASPTGFYDTKPFDGQNSYAGDNSFTDGNTDTGLITDSTMQQRQTRQASPNSWSNAQSRSSRPPINQPQSSSSSPDFFFDDASPTAGNDPDMGASQPYPRQSSGGSAWSKLRRGDNLPQARGERTQTSRSAQSRQPQDFETRSDSFAFSDREEEKRLAKELAQKDFDAMLDKERKEGGSAEYSRDMQATSAGEESTQNTGSGWSRYRKN